MQNLSLEAFLASKSWNDRFRGKSATDSDFVEFLDLGLSSLGGTYLPFCIIGVAFYPVDGSIELDMLVQIGVFGI